MDRRARTLFYGGAVITPDGIRYDDWAVAIEGTKIVAVGSHRDIKSVQKSDERLINVHGRIIAPGLIDLQINGAAGKMLTCEPSPETVRAMAAILPRFGCTAFLPTVITAPIDQMQAAARAVATVMNEPSNGARVLGTHLEGPFINPARAGAHQPSFIQAPSADLLRRLFDDGGQSAVLLTLAPEMPGGMELIDVALDLGMRVAIGHSIANFTEVNQAAKRGATLVTHLFNAMGPLGSREPGTVGAALANDELFVSLIADGVHLHPATLKIAARAKGSARVVLITDAMAPLGTDLRAFSLQDETIDVRDGACYRADGVLAGSVLALSQAVRAMHELAGVDLDEAITMASSNAARAIGYDDVTGSLAPGLDADLVILNEDMTPWLTLAQGEIRYRTGDLRD
jgi:N-acetylglucosamine-6-phosphate deacetylase